MQRTTCLLEESFESAAGVVMDVAKVAKVAIERAPPIKEVEGMVGLARPARRSAKKLCSRRLEQVTDALTPFHHIRKEKL